jgi:hypothetical protein
MHNLSPLPVNGAAGEAAAAPSGVGHAAGKVGGMKLNHFQLFTGWENEQLKAFARVLDAAAGEGEMAPDLADALCEQAEHRGIDLSSAYGLGEGNPQRWRKELDR